MNGLGPHSRALLDDARLADDAEMMAARERVRGALGRKLGVAAVGIAATTAGTAGAGTSASIGAGLLAKVTIGLAALSITAGGIAVSKHAAKPKPLPPAVTVVAPKAIELPAPIVTEKAVVVSPLTPEPPVVSETPPKPVVVQPKQVAPKVEPVVAAPPEPVAVVVEKKPSITEELQAIKRANDAIVGGRPSEALVILDTTPASPTLSEERAGLRLLATCALGHAGATDSARAFLAAHPSSPLAARLKSTCSIP